VTCVKTAVTIPQTVVRVAGPILILLGLLFWTGNALSLVPVHMLLGLILVLSLWTIAVLALVARVSPGLAFLALVWGLAVPVLGLAQGGLLVGDLHWLIRLLHLLLGLGAIGQAENLARRIKQRAYVAPASASGGGGA
jgi:hypothetical protein